MTNETSFVEIGGIAYANIIPRYYQMDPETDDLLYADELEDGMMVLIGEPEGRADETNPEFFGMSLLNFNRWCKVSKLRLNHDIVTFIGVYPDGSKTRRVSDATMTWLVKKATIPTPPASEALLLSSIDE